MRIRFENHDLDTEGCGQFIDLTDDVVKVVERSEVRDGMAVVYSPHTTCAVLINERESGFIEDFQADARHDRPAGRASTTATTISRSAPRGSRATRTRSRTGTRTAGRR